MKTGLIVVFNHRYDENIRKIRKIYASQFSYIKFLIPFYEGNDNDVIPVYENSYQFHGFLIQAYRDIIKIPCDNFLFIADDLLLNPCISENNISTILKSKEVFISDLKPFNCKGGAAWMHSKYVAKAFLSKGVSWKTLLPSFEEALRKYEKFTKSSCKMQFGEDFFSSNSSFVIDNEKDEFIKLNGGTNNIQYPLMRGYSDWFVIKKEVLFDLSRLCGVFSAMNLFVEIAIPTAIMLLFERERVLFLSETSYSQKLIWGGEIQNRNFALQFNYSIKELYSRWEQNLFCVHPVKLSSWTL